VTQQAESLLAIALESAVPLWIEELRPLTAAERQKKARKGVQAICEHGDVLQFGGGKPGQVAEAFNAIARGLAALAYQPGGVTFCGRHWEAKS
jgi:hypothetical protein